MPIHVQAPNGEVVEFPDGTSDDVMASAMQQAYGSGQQAAPAPAQPDSPQVQAASAELSQMTQNPAKALYDQLPAWKKPLVAAQDVGNIIGDAATFGMGDRAAAALRVPFTGKSYSDELAGMRAGTQVARDRAGSAGMAADVIGSVAMPMAAAGQGATLAGRFGSGAAKGVTGLAARAGLMGAEGAGYGALGAAGHGTDIGTGAAIGGAGGAAGSVIGDAIGAGLQKVSSAIKGKPNVPDISQLKAAAKSSYDAADAAGVIIKPQGMQALASDVKQNLTDFGYHPDLQPRVAVVLNEMDKLSQGNTTLKGVDVLRRIADNARQSQDPSEKALGSQIIGKIDNFVENLKPDDVLTGDAMKGASALKQARGLWGRVRKNEAFVDAVERAQLRAASTGSGGNAENATRQNVRRLLEKGRGYTPDEQAAMKELVTGTPGQNFLRLAGKLSPQGNGLMAALGVGGAIVNPIFGAASLGGLGAKALADRGVSQGVQALDTLIRSGGDAAALQAARGTLANLSQSQRETVARLVMGTSIATGREAPPAP